MRVVHLERRFGELLVVGSDKPRHECIGGVNAGDALEPQFLHQAILQRQMGALDAAFGGRRVGTDALDVELIERTRKLRVPRARGSRRSVDAKKCGTRPVEAR